MVVQPYAGESWCKRNYSSTRCCCRSERQYPCAWWCWNSASVALFVSLMPVQALPQNLNKVTGDKRSRHSCAFSYLHSAAWFSQWHAFFRLPKQGSAQELIRPVIVRCGLFITMVTQQIFLHTYEGHNDGPAWSYCPAYYAACNNCRFLKSLMIHHNYLVNFGICLPQTRDESGSCVAWVILALKGAKKVI